MPSCIKWGESRVQECTQTADQGYNECTESRDQGYKDCCDWWPCSWACKAWVWVSNIVCVAWTWVSNIVCVAWTWVTTAVCVMWDIVTTALNAVYVTIESIIGWVLSAAAFLIEIILAIPGIGAIVRWIINGFTNIFYIFIGLVDAGLGLIGIRPEKKLRLCAVILRDERNNPVASMEFAKAVVQLAVDVYKRDANIRIIPSKAFQYDSGFDGAETVDDSWITIDDGSSDKDILDAPEKFDNVWADLGTKGSEYQLIMSRCCFYGSWRRIIGYGAPITCFFIRSVGGGDLGYAVWSTDYVKVVGQQRLPARSPRVVGHEIGHLGNLWHTCVLDDIRNIMATGGACDPDSTVCADRADPRLSNFQVLSLRASKYATYF